MNPPVKIQLFATIHCHPERSAAKSKDPVAKVSRKHGGNLSPSLRVKLRQAGDCAGDDRLTFVGVAACQLTA